jgi:transposase-like protein
VIGSLIQKVGAKRQRRSNARKRKIVEQTMQLSVAWVAQQYGVNANQVFYWPLSPRPSGREEHEQHQPAAGEGSPGDSEPRA